MNGPVAFPLVFFKAFGLQGNKFKLQVTAQHFHSKEVVFTRSSQAIFLKTILARQVFLKISLTLTQIKK